MKRRLVFASITLGVGLLVVILFASRPSVAPEPLDDARNNMGQGNEVTPPGIQPTSEIEPPKEFETQTEDLLKNEETVEKELPPPTEKIRGTVLLPFKMESYKYWIYVFTPEGKIERSKKFSDRTDFEIDKLSPGSKAVIFWCQNGEYSPTSAIVQVSEGLESQVAISPGTPFPLTGVIVDQKGDPVSGVIVAVTEHLPLAKSFFSLDSNRNHSSAGYVASAGGISSSSVHPLPSHLIKWGRLDPVGGKVARGLPTDDSGNFSLTASSPTTPVKIRVFRKLTKTLVEGTYLPNQSPLRITLPQQ